MQGPDQCVVDRGRQRGKVDRKQKEGSTPANEKDDRIESEKGDRRRGEREREKRTCVCVWRLGWRGPHMQCNHGEGVPSLHGEGSTKHAIIEFRPMYIAQPSSPRSA